MVNVNGGMYEQLHFNAPLTYVTAKTFFLDVGGGAPPIRWKGRQGGQHGGHRQADGHREKTNWVPCG